MPTKLKRFCRITKFLEQHDKELYQTIDDLCLFNLFRSRGNGITFLHPSDKAFRKKIIDSAYSDSPEKAIDMIRSLVLMDYLPSPKDFESKKDDIPNALRKRLEVASADAKTVTLKSGHKLTVESKFAPIRSNDPSAVYILSGPGPLPLTGPSANMKYAQKKAPDGEFSGGGGHDKTKLVRFVESNYPTHNNIYKAVLAFLYKKAQFAGDDVVCNVYRGMCASARATFYVLMCPHSIGDPYNLGTVMTDVCSFSTNIEPSNISESLSICASEYEKLRDEIIKTSRDKLMINQREILETTSLIRKSLLSETSSFVDIRAVLTQAYNGDKNRLAKDVFTVYCFLSSINEVGDSSYYTNCFTFVVKNIYNDLTHVLNHNRDLAFNLSVYLNLIKSDALVYVPALSAEPPEPGFTRQMPDPTSKSDLFSIYKNESTEKTGGGDSLASFMSS
jgi:hypothetical protein